MKTMTLSDLIIMRNYLAQQSVVGLALGILLAFVMENPYIVSPLITVGGTCAITVLALDERNGWERYRLAMPISRANVVYGRYASLAIAVAVGLVVGLVASPAAMVLASAFMAMGYDVNGMRALGEGIDPGAYTLSASMGLLFITVALAVTLNATSAAVAEAAYIAAELENAYPDLWSETIRGLLVHSARWSRAMIDRYSPEGSPEDTSTKGRRRLLRACGYGIPDLTVQSNARRTASTSLFKRPYIRMR